MHAQVPLYKNIVPFLASSAPEAIDMSDPTEAQKVLIQSSHSTRRPHCACALSSPRRSHGARVVQVLQFYEMLFGVGKSLSGGGEAGGGAPTMALPALLRAVATTLDVFIVYDRSVNTYCVHHAGASTRNSPPLLARSSRVRGRVCGQIACLSSRRTSAWTDSISRCCCRGNWMARMGARMGTNSSGM